jgi:3-dehydroquinate dehydratase / shikimate dehydrogenase
MICVTLGRGRHSALLEEWKAVAEAGAELVELRLDCLRREPDLKRILANRYTKMIITVRRGVDGGLWRGDEEKRQRLMREAIVAGVDYVDLESDVAPLIRRFGKTQRIVSMHNFRKTPDDLEEIARPMREMDADIVKVATIAHSMSDASRVLELVAKSNWPTIGIAMGDKGYFTRILGAKFGAPLTYCGFNPDRTFAPGQPRLNDLKRDYEYDKIDKDTEIYAVVGDPIGHSLSPAVHNACFRRLELNKVMVPLLIPAGELKESLEVLSWLNIKGFSVTIPHKEAVVPLLSRSDKAVERTGACNTAIEQDGRWVGYNTDYRAAMTVLEDALGGPRSDGLSPLVDKQVLILGAGGVARAIAFGLVRRGAGVGICNRNDERALKLAEEASCRAVSWGMRAGTMCDILINCTPVGMHPDVDASPVPAAAFKPGMVAFDTIYHPEHTLFMKLARDHDCITASGVDMFVEQAALQFQHYTATNAPIDLMREVLKRKLGAVRE